MLMLSAFMDIIRQSLGPRCRGSDDVDGRGIIIIVHHTLTMIMYDFVCVSVCVVCLICAHLYVVGVCTAKERAYPCVCANSVPSRAHAGRARKLVLA